jgi:hypothetical protein
MPVCDNCQGESEGQCIYTPKMRASVSSGDVFVSGFVAPSSGSRSDVRKAEYRTTSISSYDRTVLEDGSSRTSMTRFINTSSGSVSLAAPVKLWHHPAFMPLPGVVSSFLNRANAAEMPSRDLWDQSLSSFLRSLMPAVRDTACFSPETYSDMVKAIISGDRTKLSTNVDRWMTCHPLRLGSKETNFLIIPRDDVYQSSMESQLLKDYRMQADYAKRYGRAPVNLEPGPSLPCQAFTWIPIKEQIYDILAYAHREHSNSFDMMKDVERLLVVSSIQNKKCHPDIANLHICRLLSHGQWLRCSVKYVLFVLFSTIARLIGDSDGFRTEGDGTNLHAWPCTTDLWVARGSALIAIICTSDQTVIYHISKNHDLMTEPNNGPWTRNCEISY